MHITVAYCGHMTTIKEKCGKSQFFGNYGNLNNSPYLDNQNIDISKNGPQDMIPTLVSNC